MIDVNDLLIMAATLKTIGEIIIAGVLLSLHLHIVKERQIDADVLMVMQREKTYLIVAVMALIAGYAVELLARTTVLL